MIKGFLQRIQKIKRALLIVASGLSVVAAIVVLLRSSDESLPMKILTKHLEEVAIRDGMLLHPMLLDLDSTGRYIVSVKIPGTSVSNLHWLETFESLRFLDVSGTTVRSVVGLQFDNQLQHLNMAYTPVQDIEHYSFPELRALDLSGYLGTELHITNRMPNLEELRIDNSQLERLRIDSGIPLRFLSAKHSPRLKTVDMDRVSTVRSIDLRGCGSLDALNLSEGIDLDRLDLSFCNNLMASQYVIPDSTSLYLQGWKAHAAQLTSLQGVEVLDISKSIDFPLDNLSSLFRLRELRFNEPVSVTSVSPLIHNLEILEMRKWVKPFPPYSFRRCAKVRELDISGSRGVCYDSVSVMKMLGILRVNNIGDVLDLNQLNGPFVLYTLEVKGTELIGCPKSNSLRYTEAITDKNSNIPDCIEGSLFRLRMEDSHLGALR